MVLVARVQAQHAVASGRGITSCSYSISDSLHSKSLPRRSGFARLWQQQAIGRETGRAAPRIRADASVPGDGGGEQSSGGASSTSSQPVTRSALPRVGPVKFDHVMLAILDANPYLDDSSRGAAATAAALAGSGSGKVTVLLVDEEDLGDSAATRMDMLKTSLREAGCHEFEVLDQVAPPSAAAACGDVADAREADLLVVSCDAVHSKALDANLLAEVAAAVVVSTISGFAGRAS